MKQSNTPSRSKWTLFATIAIVALFVIAPDAMAQQKEVCGVMVTVLKLLRAASIIVVTIAIIFAGYQIAFAHKRISDVAPILIGGLLIGAAAQIASMMIGTPGTSDSCSTTYLQPVAPQANPALALIDRA